MKRPVVTAPLFPGFATIRCAEMALVASAGAVERRPAQ